MSAPTDHGSGRPAVSRRGALRTGASVGLACGIGAAGWGLARSAAAAPAAPGELVRWPTVTLLDGQPLAAHQLRDTAAIVVFFATTCPFCRRHNQHVEKLVRATRGLPLQVIAAAQDKTAAPVQAYLQQHQYSFAVTLDEKPLHDALSARKVIPLTCVIDRGGRLREVIPGEMFEEDVLELAKWARA